jgi:hypothetical protein
LTIEQRPKRLRRVPGGVAGRIARDFDKLGKKGDLGCKIVVSDDVFGGNLRGASADASVFMVASIPSIARHRDDRRAISIVSPLALMLSHFSPSPTSRRQILEMATGRRQREV